MLGMSFMCRLDRKKTSTKRIEKYIGSLLEILVPFCELSFFFCFFFSIFLRIMIFSFAIPFFVGYHSFRMHYNSILASVLNCCAN